MTPVWSCSSHDYDNISDVLDLNNEEAILEHNMQAEKLWENALRESMDSDYNNKEKFF